MFWLLIKIETDYWRPITIIHVSWNFYGENHQNFNKTWVLTYYFDFRQLLKFAALLAF
jgi:hypothetical protein